MKRIGLALCCVLIAASVAGCSNSNGAPMLPDGARYDNGGSLGGGGRSGGTTISTDSTSQAAPLNGGSLGAGG